MKKLKKEEETGANMSDGRSSNSNTPAAGDLAQNHHHRPPPPHLSAGPSIRPHTKIPEILPHERVFPIQIGSELFKLSGASISSDAPSYFSQYFLCQIKQAEDNGDDPATAIRTLYIDRDPVTFRDISLHLQGYHVSPRDGTHFVRLFADAQFYTLPKLISQLHEESIFMSIGHTEFQIPRDLFSDPGNSPNFFSLGFAIFFSDPSDLFPGLDREGLIRPPSILPPCVPGRSAEVFAELLHLLRGYPLQIRSDEHRATLLKDCRYFNFRGLEQRLIPHARAFNQFRGRDEIVLRLEDILKSGVSDEEEDEEEDEEDRWVHYARPFVDHRSAELILEVGGENMRLHFHAPGDTGMRVEFFRDGRVRLTKLFEVIASKLNLPPTTQPLGLLMKSGGASSQPPTPGNTPLSDDWVKCEIPPETAITLDGRKYTGHRTVSSESSGGNEATETPNAVGTAPTTNTSSSAGMAIDSPTEIAGLSLYPPRKRKRVDGGHLNGVGVPEEGYWTLKTAQWRLRIQGVGSGRTNVECVLIAVKINALSGEYARNEAKSFLMG
ncbi:hypothetical protein M406DRAFT_89349 [Cryphonectria parasitica EP155]|uniref:BTB/POZ domain-containing protein n=1 Tax=Cryphonectria parasitica (strain ATCC 38755 / EP155) TaxID=660469 RepID=A0A9P5CPV4_CRYP1|nr:uncharacterized protein M406DRAFT_89349 [Cryphonectria parasitica EP155]KAF3766578.1 hypothetical protein M406DRAFT_89349 [Cryphonectria parasitica EP155]